MDLTPRKQAILAAIVKYHIATGGPVGSKWLTTTLENAPSSATLRNEMSELSSMGFLTQPHTSAGRVPTNKGYEFYVSNLMQKDEITDREKAYINKCMEEAAADTENVHILAAKILSLVTGLPAFAAKSADEKAVIKKVQLSLLGGRLIMMVVITGDGRTKSKLIRSASLIEEDKLSALDSLVKTQVEGKNFKELSFAAMQNIYAAAGSNALALMPLMASLFDIINEMAQPQIDFSGETKIYSLFSGQQAARLLMFLEKKDGFLSVVEGTNKETGVIFGNHTGFYELENATVVLSAYGAKDSAVGKIGVIGPTRMSYGHIVSVISYLAEKLGEILNQGIKDLEEY